MSKLKFDGKYLKDGAKVIANVSGNSIRKESSAAVIGNISGNNIRQGSGSSVLFNVSGDDIRQGSGSSRVATMRDVDAAIEGPGKVIKAALWVLCCR